MTKKPTGHAGPIKASPISVEVEWEKIQFPSTKDEQEKYIAERFIQQANKQRSERFRFKNLRQNAQADLDFTVEVAEGDIYLELLEIAPLQQGGYETALSSHKPYDMAEWIIKQIRKKGTKQGPGLDRVLLLYWTHWAFALSSTTIALLQYWLLEEDFDYLEILIYEPLDTEEGSISTLVPVPKEHFQGFDPEQYRDNVVLNLDPAKFELIKGSTDAS